MSDIVSYGLLIFNGLTITTVGWLYISYFKNLNYRGLIENAKTK